MTRTDLTSLPEIGKVTAEQLRAVGIPDTETFRAVGAREAFLRIRSQLDPGACIQLLTGLEAAVQGVRAGDLSPQIRADLNRWKKSLG